MQLAISKFSKQVSDGAVQIGITKNDKVEDCFQPKCFSQPMNVEEFNFETNSISIKGVCVFYEKGIL